MSAMTSPGDCGESCISISNEATAIEPGPMARARSVLTDHGVRGDTVNKDKQALILGVTGLGALAAAALTIAALKRNAANFETRMTLPAPPPDDALLDEELEWSDPDRLAGDRWNI